MLILGILVFVLAFINVFLIFKLKKPTRKQEIDEKQVELARKRAEGFSNLMQYDYETAVRREN